MHVEHEIGAEHRVDGQVLVEIELPIAGIGAELIIDAPASARGIVPEQAAGRFADKAADPGQHNVSALRSECGIVNAADQVEQRCVQTHAPAPPGRSSNTLGPPRRKAIGAKLGS